MDIMSTGLNRLFLFSLVMLALPASSTAAPSLRVNGVEANYSTTKIFIDETEGESYPLEIFFDPDANGASDVQIFSNLNRRDYADADVDGDGIHDGIDPVDGATIDPGDSNGYYCAYAMAPTNSAEFHLRLDAEKTGAYRLTARYRLDGEWQWYSSDGRRDHAIVVSPRTARDIRLYELNTLTVEAGGSSFDQRSTFEDLHDAPGALHTSFWNLDYLENLGCNWLWFQPIHPQGVDGRETDPDTGSPYDPGSPYAVKNFFEVMPQMSRANTRADAMTVFSNFVADCDQRDLGVMLDAPFNHTAWDCELAGPGVELFAPTAAPSEEIRNREARFYSRSGHYGMRAYDADSIATAPDRNDFGKWDDVKDVFFGRYDALVETDTADENDNHLDEGDQFYYGDPLWTGDDISRNVWRYFAEYTLHWLDRTGYPGNPEHAALDSDAGIDGLRCDFGQGLPPQAWEYIINVARSRKWNFVFMSESLDGGAVTYRSNRHFDLLNENIVFALKSAAGVSDYRSVFEDRRNAYGQGLVLLNNVSHDEENFADPWNAVIRYGVCSTVDGAPMIFHGQELGISKTWGFDSYETNFGKQIPQFKRYNSMMDAWNDNDFGNDQLYPVIAGINSARAESPALRDSKRYFLNRSGGGVNESIFSVAKYVQAGGSPAFNDVVFGFVNIDRDKPQSDVFDLAIDSGGENLFGIETGRVYNVRNIAAYDGIDPGRRGQWLWGADGRSGAELLENGIYVGLNAVPVTRAGWTNAPYEAQYLRLYDITAPAPPAAPIAPAAYVIGSNVGFSWSMDSFGADDNIADFVFTAGTAPGGSELFDGSVGASSNVSFGVNPGDSVYAGLAAVSAAGVTGAVGSVAGPVHALPPDGDFDGDGLLNADEDYAGSNPLDEHSRFGIMQIREPHKGQDGYSIQIGTATGRCYRIFYADLLGGDIGEWRPFANTNLGYGVWCETGQVGSTYTFIDDESSDTSSNAPPTGVRLYRIEVERR